MLVAVLGALLLAAPFAQAVSTESISLDGRWRLAPDVLRDAGPSRWTGAPSDYCQWGTVTVPHSWFTDPRYQYGGRTCHG